MNVTLRGKIGEIVDSMVVEGYANTKSEAIRLAIINFWESHSHEDESVNKKLDRIDNQIKKGKRKVLNSKKALGSYAKYLK